MPYNPILIFWIIIAFTILLIGFLIKRHRKRYDLFTNKIKIINIHILTTLILILGLSSFQYWSMSQQGLQTLFINPYTAAKAANIAPKPSQITSAKEIESLTNEEKSDKIIIVFKFGCVDCQRLWLYAQKHPELLPSKNVLWVSNKESNKNISKLVAESTRYPAIHYWNTNESTLKKQVIQEPTKQQLIMLSELAKNKNNTK